MGIIKEIDEFLGSLTSDSKRKLHLKSCKACNFFKNGYCTQVQPPSKILNVYEAQICIYYTVETPTVLEKVPTVEKVEKSYVKGIKGIESRTFRQKRTSIGDSDVFDVKGKGITINRLSASCTHKTNCYLTIYPYESDGSQDDSLSILDSFGTLFLPVNPEHLNLYKSDILEEYIYDTENNYYKFGLKRNLHFAHGARIQMRIVNADAKFTCEAMVNIEGE